MAECRRHSGRCWVPSVRFDPLEYYGFQQTLTKPDGELFYEKPLSDARLELGDNGDLFTLDRTNYPRFICREPAKAFCVPIRGTYHRKLFPEISKPTPLPLFPEGEADFVPISSNRTPGNTIRKVYLCRAQTTAMVPGDVLLFYHSRLPGFLTSQTMTSVGIVEAVTATRNFDELVRLTAKRSVFSEIELRNMIDESEAPIKVIDFLLVGHIDPPISLDELLAHGVFVGRPPQSISFLPPPRFTPVRRRIELGFEL